MRTKMTMMIDMLRARARRAGANQGKGMDGVMMTGVRRMMMMMKRGVLRTSMRAGEGTESRKAAGRRRTDTTDLTSEKSEWVRMRTGT
jgi:hypothetical protein